MGDIYQLKTGHCVTGQYLQGTKNRTSAKYVWVPIQGTDAGASAQELPALEAATEDPVGRGTENDWEGEEQLLEPGPVRGQGTRPILDSCVPLRWGAGRNRVGQGRRLWPETRNGKTRWSRRMRRSGKWGGFFPFGRSFQSLLYDFVIHFRSGNRPGRGRELPHTPHADCWGLGRTVNGNELYIISP